LYARVIEPVTHLTYVNADEIAAERWPSDPSEHPREAARLADDLRAEMLEARRSFASETVFSHPSRLEMVRTAVDRGYLVTIHVVLVPEELAVQRVADRVNQGGHAIRESRIRQRFGRLWPLVVDAVRVAEEAFAYDNSSASCPFRQVAHFYRGHIVGTPQWPSWAPEPLTKV